MPETTVARRTELRYRLADAATRSDRVAEFLPEFRSWIDDDPLNERAVCMTAAALGQIGQTAAIVVPHRSRLL